MNGESFSFEEIEDIFAATHARNRVVLMDTCHAGDAVPSGLTEQSNSTPESVAVKTRSALKFDELAPTDVTARRLFLEHFAASTGKSGAIVVAAADASGLALESEQWQNGAFTFVLREAITDRMADLNQDLRITASELSDYLQRRIPELTGGNQLPQQKRSNQEIDPVLASWSQVLVP